METFLERLREILKRVVREVSAYLFKKELIGKQGNHPDGRGLQREMLLPLTIPITNKIITHFQM